MSSNTLLPVSQSSFQFPGLRWLATALAVALSGSIAFAGAAEFKLLNLKLGGSTTVNAIATATSAQLAAAVVAVITENPKVNGGTVAGEALKGAGPAAPDAGAQVADAVVSAFPGGVPFGPKTLTLRDFAAQAIKTTASGKGLTVTHVPDFAARFVATDTEAIALAGLVKSSTRAAGAVLRGRAAELPSDTERQALANSALVEKTLAAAIQDVTAGIAATVTNAVAFTNALVANPSNLKNLLKIVPGVAAGQPAAAGAVVEAAFAAFDTQGIASPIVKGAAALAKSVGLAADIEQVQRVGTAIAARIGAGAIKLSQLNPIATTLAKAIVSKPLAISGPNRNANKVDELGELAAYVLAGVVSNADFIKAPDKAVVGFIKAIIAGAKSSLGPSLLDIESYVVGSIALTIANLPTGPVKTALIAALQNPATAKSIGGTALAAVVSQAISDGLAGTPGRFENGTDAGTGALTDPETNSRNL